MQTDDFKQITNQNAISKFKQSTHDIFKTPGYIDKEWLLKRNWISVPVEDRPHANYIPTIVNALNKINSKEVYALLVGYERTGEEINAEGLTRPAECFKIYISKSSLKDLLREIAPASYIITSSDLTFLIFSSDAEFSVICGPEEFVKNAVGESIQQARQGFIEYALTKTWSKGEKQFYLDIEKYYR